MEVTEETIELLTKRPLLAVPDEIRGPLLKLWTMNQELFPSALPLAICVNEFLSQGLLPAEAVSAIRSLMSMEMMGKFRFASELKTELAKRAAAIVSTRKAREEMIARRKDSVPADRSALNDIGRPESN